MADFHLAVIGAGSAGLSVAAVAGRLGLRVALIERGRMGGECLNTGCVPSKALLAAGRAGVGWQSARQRVQGAIAAIEPHDSAERFTGLGCTVLHGEARFCGRDALAISGQGRLTARRIVVAAGSRPAVPAIEGLAALPYLTSETLFGLAERPAHLVILGGGPVAAEMAQAHADLGCAVTIVTRGRLCGREDPEMADILRRVLLARGVAIHEHAQVRRAEPDAVLVLDGAPVVAGSHLLVAAGRLPNLETLDLGAGGVAADATGILTDRGLRSRSNRAVFAAGDIAAPDGIGAVHLTHAASHHAAVIVRRAVFRLPARVSTTMPRVIYTHPELAWVGMMQREAGQVAGAQVFRAALSTSDRAMTDGISEGLVKLVARHGRLVGAGIVAPAAGEMLGLLTYAVRQRLSLSVLAQLVVPYPTLFEAVRRAASGAFEARLFSRPVQRAAAVLASL